MSLTRSPKPKKKIGERHKQAVFLFVGLVVAYMQRVNLSVGLVAMTDPEENSNVPVLNYTTEEKGKISSMFFYGYMISGLPAGILADKYGPIKFISIVGGIFCGIVTVLVPFTALHIGLWAVFSLRVLQGLGQGFFYPCINAHLSKWIPPEERGQITWMFTGAQFGTIIMLAVGGELAAGTSGWPSIFHYSGVFGMIWGAAFFVFGADSPATHRSITKEERDYIQSHLVTPTSEKEVEVPWCALATSLPFLSLAFVHMCQNWGFFTLLTLIPTYIHGVYGFNVKQNGFLSALPYVGMMVGGFFFSSLATKMAQKFSANVNRKFFNSVGLYGPAMALTLLSIFTMNAAGAILLVTIATTLNAAVFNGFQINHLDLAPNLAGILMGFTNGGSNVAAIVAPQFAGHVVGDESNNSEWQIVFLVTSAMSVVGNTIWLIFGSTEMQPWNDPDYRRNGKTEMHSSTDDFHGLDKDKGFHP